MKKSVIRVALTFGSMTQDQLNSFLILLLVCQKNNPLFPNLPVKYVDLQALVANYQAKMAASAIGGSIDTAAFSEARDAVLIALRQIAGYIQSFGLTNVSDVLSSGFDVILRGKNPKQPLTMPVFALDNSVPGQVGFNLAAVLNAKSYHVQYCIGDGPMIELGIFPNTKNILLPSTVAGTLYSARIQAIGGSTNYSPWSAVMTIMSL